MSKMNQVDIFQVDWPKFAQCYADDKGNGKDQCQNKFDGVSGCS